MNSDSRRFVFRVVGFVALAIAAAAPWAGVLAGTSGNNQGQPHHRRTTDPPVPASGKLGQDLFIAIDHRDLAGVKALIKKGADVNARNGLEFTPLYIAAASHQPDVMNALLAAGAKCEADSPYGTALTFAAITGHTEGARILFAKGANVNTMARVDGISPLMMAAHAGNPETVAELLSHKAKVNETNVANASALTFAARAGHVAIGRMLLDRGAAVDNLDADKETPLMAASKTGHPEFVKLLLERGAKPNARDKRGRTAIILAASYGDYPEVIKTLLEGGADPKVKDSKGRTASDLASARGYVESAEILGKPVAVPAKDERKVITASLKLLERSMSAFSRNTACISCHQEGLGRMVTASARDHGLPVDSALNKAQLGRIRGALGFMQPLHLRALKNPEAMKQVPLIEINEVNTGDAWLLAGMAAQNDPPTVATGAMAMVLARQQSPEGNWTFSLPRAPMQSSFFTFTALSVRSLNAYGPKANAAEIGDRIGKAKAWLAKAEAKSIDDRAFQLLGLKWAGLGMKDRQGAAEALLGMQQPDGGWAQMPGVHSDAYATGLALYALELAGGVSTSNPAFEKGIQFLLRTQDDDGSWFVNKRAIPANNYFDAEFPHGESQFASFNGTCWAVLALLEALQVK